MELLKKVFLFGAVWIVAHFTFMLAEAVSSPEKADAAVVLGSKVNEDGSLSPRLLARLDKAVALYEDGIVSRVIVSGGLGMEGWYEGDKMYEYLLSRNLPASALLTDNQGSNTRATARNSYKIAQEEGIESVVAVSQYFHVTRSKMLLGRAGFSEVYTAAPFFVEWRDIYSVPREILAYYVDLFRKI